MSLYHYTDLTFLYTTMYRYNVMSEDKITKEWLDLDQRILYYIFQQDGGPVTIEEVKTELEEPRTTISEHLNYLAREGFLEVQKDGRTKNFYAQESVLDEVGETLTTLRSSLITALDKIKKRELEELEGLND